MPSEAQTMVPEGDFPDMSRANRHAGDDDEYGTAADELDTVDARSLNRSDTNLADELREKTTDTVDSSVVLENMSQDSIVAQTKDKTTLGGRNCDDDEDDNVSPSSGRPLQQSASELKPGLREAGEVPTPKTGLKNAPEVLSKVKGLGRSDPNPSQRDYREDGESERKSNGKAEADTGASSNSVKRTIPTGEVRTTRESPTPKSPSESGGDLSAPDKRMWVWIAVAVGVFLFTVIGFVIWYWSQKEHKQVALSYSSLRPPHGGGETIGDVLNDAH